MDNNETSSFQQSMDRLEAIVRQLNQPGLPLEQAMALFREGMDLSKQCQDKLAAFEKEMNQLITEDAA